MAQTNPKVSDFLNRAKKWQKELTALRAIVLDCGLDEELKWRQPCYTFEGANVVILSGFKEYCALMFFKGVLLADPEGVLVAPGENSQSARQMRFTEAREIAGMEPVIKAYIDEAVEAERAGLKVKFKSISEQERPDELERRLNAELALKAAFEALTPGRRRAYILHFSQPKQAKTRESRIDKCAPRILDGKGLRD